MNYQKLKVSYKGNPKRLNRVIGIREDVSLVKLGHIIGETINCWFEHGFLFKTPFGTFVPTTWLEDAMLFDNYLPLNNYQLSDLGDSFTFEYDTGEGYEFECKLLKRTHNYEEEENDQPVAFVIEGKGQGIFENDRYTLDRYLEGLIDPESSDEDEDEMIFLPMNMDFETYGDFDNPLDLDEYVYYDDELYYQEKEYIKREKEFLGDLYEKLLEEDYEFEDDDDYDFEDDEEDLFDDDELEAVFSARSMVAVQIFENPEVLEVFEKLLKKHSVYESYEIIVDTFIHSVELADTDVEYEKIVMKELKKLLKN